MLLSSPPKTILDAETFDAFTQLPENRETHFERIGGEIVPAPSNPYSSYIGSIILYHLMGFKPCLYYRRGRRLYGGG